MPGKHEQLRVRNRNNGARHPAVQFTLSGHRTDRRYDEFNGGPPLDPIGTVYFHLQTSFIMGGFHMSLKDAQRLHRLLGQAIANAGGTPCG